MILVTGATGFIGRSLTRALDHAGHAWQPYTARLSDAAALAEALDGATTIIHLAGAEARGNRRLLQQVDVEGTQRLVAAARQAGARRLIVPSRLHANVHAIHPLPRAKGEVERLVARSGIPYTILRTTTLFGRDDRFSEPILSLALWSWPFAWVPNSGTMPTQPLWVEDFSYCLVQTLDRPDLVNQTLTIGGAERLSYRDLVRTMLNVTGRQRILLPVPLKAARRTARFLLTWWHWPPVSRFFLDRFSAPEVVELDAAQRAFGLQPARFGETITYLNRGGMRWRLFRK